MAAGTWVETADLAVEAQGAKADTAVQTVNSKTGTAVDLNVYDIPQAVPEGEFDSTIYGRQDGSWVPIPSGSLPASKWDISNGVPTGAPSNPDAFQMDATTGIFYRWTVGSSGTGGYSFNGTTQYATMSPAWATLGNPAIYSSATFDAAEPSDAVIVQGNTSEFGRVPISGGYRYHNGNLSSLQLVDSSPFQGVVANKGQTGTIGGSPAGILMTEGKFTFEWVAPASVAAITILTGYLTTSASKFVLSGDCLAGSLLVDDLPYANEDVIANRHYTISLRTTGGTFTTLNSGGGMRKLSIQAVN